MEKLRALLREGEADLLAALKDDLGKPETEAYLSEIAFVEGEIAFALKRLKSWNRPRRVRTGWLTFPASGKIFPSPYGTALIIGPWNYPLQLLLAPLVGALAAGNTAVLKPSELAPKTSRTLTRLIGERFDPALLAAVEGGAEVAFGGESDPAELYLSPTVVRNLPAGHPLHQEEIFGPILPVLTYRALDEALDFVNRRHRPLAFYFFSSDRKRQRRVITGTVSGGVCLNDTVSQILPPRLPFGGVGESGMGSYHGKASFETFSRPRSVLSRSTRLDPRFRYPPYRTPLKSLKKITRLIGQ